MIGNNLSPDISQVVLKGDPYGMSGLAALDYYARPECTQQWFGGLFDTSCWADKWKGTPAPPLAVPAPPAPQERASMTNWSTEDLNLARASQLFTWRDTARATAGSTANVNGSLGTATPAGSDTGGALLMWGGIALIGTILFTSVAGGRR